MQPDQTRLSPKSTVASGLFLGTLVLLFVFLGGWMWLGRLEESITASGQMVPEGNIRRVMAPTGGIVTRVNVKENQLVKAGDVLVEMDLASTEIEKSAISLQLQQLRDEARALQAATNGNTVAVSGSSFGNIQEAWLDATRSKYNADIQAADMRMQRLEYEHKEALERQKQTSEIVATSETRLKEYQALYAEGGLSKNDLASFEQEVYQHRGNARAAEQDVMARKLALEEARHAPVQVSGGYRQEMLDRLSQLQQKIVMAERDYEKNALFESHQKIFAPIDGVVHQLDLKGNDEVVEAGKVLISIVPAETPLVAEVKITNQDMSFVHIGQKARIDFEALPKFEFGSVYGEVTGISPSTVAEQDGKVFYLVRIRPEKTSLSRDGKDYLLKSGMTLSANLITRDKNILSFFTEPFQNHVNKAFKDPGNR